MDVVAASPVWTKAPYVLRYEPTELAQRIIAGRHSGVVAPPWFDSGPTAAPFDFSAAVARLVADICRHTPDLAHIKSTQILFGVIQARNARGHGLQARVTPLRFPGGHLVRHARGRVYQVQRFIVGGIEMLYLMTFCLPRFLNQSFDEKFVTLFHELFHIGPNFDGDLRRHRGRYSLHTASKTDYDRGMGQYARQYLSGGANPKLYEFLRLDFGQLQHRHGRVLGVVLPRAKILPVPVG